MAYWRKLLCTQISAALFLFRPREKNSRDRQKKIGTQDAAATPKAAAQERAAGRKRRPQQKQSDAAANAAALLRQHRQAEEARTGIVSNYLVSLLLTAPVLNVELAISGLGGGAPCTNECRCFQANEHFWILPPRGQTLPQSSAAAAPTPQHPKLRDAVHLNQMFLPSSEPGQTGWHILDPDGKRVMDPKRLMMEEEESGAAEGTGQTAAAAGERKLAGSNEKAGGRLAADAGAGAGGNPQPKAEKKGDSDEDEEEDFAASNKDSLRGVFLPIDAPDEDKDE